MDWISIALRTSWIVFIIYFFIIAFIVWFSEKVLKKESTIVDEKPIIFLPVFLFFMIAIIFSLINWLYPMNSIFYVVNGNSDRELVTINDEYYFISPKNYLRVNIRGYKKKHHIGFDEGTVPIDEKTDKGVFLVNLFDKQKVYYEELIYLPAFLANTFNHKKRPSPLGKGVYKITENLDDRIYAFDEESPRSITTKEGEKEDYNRYELRYYD